MQSNVRVVCRFRPNEGETINSLGFDDSMTSVYFKSKDTLSFAFDKIFDSNASQQRVFDYTAKQIVQDIMNGYNGTIFAYGQTGSGKTYTMMGELHDSELEGLTPRLVESIFHTIYHAPSDIEFTVKVSFMEIYMEKIKDLLNPINDNLPIQEDKTRGVYVKGLLEVFVGSVAEVFKVLSLGQLNRATAATEMNAASSRSHSIFCFTISQRNLTDDSVKTGRLYLVDLAGSEKVARTGATGQTLEEAKKINKSLTTLGMVINNLTEKSGHIPYRDSKLTRILKESLGGNSRTSLIINCSSSLLDESETLSTLRFGLRAKAVKCVAKVNLEISRQELEKKHRKAQETIEIHERKIEKLTSELSKWRNGISVDKKDWVDSSIDKAMSHCDSGVAINDDGSLNDLLSEIQSKNSEIESLLSELSNLKESNLKLITENTEMSLKLDKTVAEYEKESFENKEKHILIQELQYRLKSANETIENLNSDIETSKKCNELKRSLTLESLKEYLTEDDIQESCERSVDYLEAELKRQSNEFDILKRKLMNDLQNRCEKVVELEILLDETRNEYRNVIQPNKLPLLERNIQQLSLVQKQLIEQNSNYKKQQSNYEKKLKMRDDRIATLENLLQEMQLKFEEQRQMHQFSRVPESLSSGRIVKPLRGGHEEEEIPPTPKSQWYISLLK